ELFTRDFVYAMGWTQPVAYHRVGGDVNRVGFSADGKSLRVGCYEGSAFRLNARTGRGQSPKKPPADQGGGHAGTINGSGWAAGRVGEKAILVWRVPRWDA